MAVPQNNHSEEGSVADTRCAVIVEDLDVITPANVDFALGFCSFRGADEPRKEHGQEEENPPRLQKEPSVGITLKVGSFEWGAAKEKLHLNLPREIFPREGSSEPKKKLFFARKQNKAQGIRVFPVRDPDLKGIPPLVKQDFSGWSFEDHCPVAPNLPDTGARHLQSGLLFSR